MNGVGLFSLSEMTVSGLPDLNIMHQQYNSLIVVFLTHFDLNNISDLCFFVFFFF